MCMRVIFRATNCVCVDECMRVCMSICVCVISCAQLIVATTSPEIEQSRT